jgi:hypothetical protein
MKKRKGGKVKREDERGRCSGKVKREGKGAR